MAITLSRLPTTAEGLAMKLGAPGIIFYSKQGRNKLYALAKHYGWEINIESGIFTNIQDDRKPAAQYLKRVTLIKKSTPSNDTEPKND